MSRMKPIYQLIISCLVLLCQNYTFLFQKNGFVKSVPKILAGFENKQ